MLHKPSVSPVNFSNTFLNTFITPAHEVFCDNHFYNLLMHIYLLEMFLKQILDNLMEYHFILVFVEIWIYSLSSCVRHLSFIDLCQVLLVTLQVEESASQFSLPLCISCLLLLAILIFPCSAFA